MSVTYPNQKIVKIHKEKCVDNFTQIQNEHMYAASRCLNGSAFKLYMYLASNADDFELALSRKDVIDKTGISYCAYDDAVASLIKNGYLVLVSGSTYDFNTYPENHIYENHIYENHKRDILKIIKGYPENHKRDILKTIKEIDSKDNKDILYINKSEEINSSESKENNSSKPKRISRKDQLVNYINGLDFSSETKTTLFKWLFTIGLKRGVTCEQLGDMLSKLDIECGGDEHSVHEAINASYLSGWFGFFRTNQYKNNTSANKPVEPTRSTAEWTAL